MGNLFTACRGIEEGQCVFLALAVSEATLIWNNVPKWHILEWTALNLIIRKKKCMP